jgi:hypothetical protein
VKAAAGPLFFSVFAFLTLGGAWAMWPADFFSTPFSAMPASMLIRAVASAILVFGALEFFCALAIVLRSDS